MIPEWLFYVAIGLVSLTSLGLLVIQDWRWCIAILALQYVGVVLLVSFAWEIELAATIIVSGWMAASLLGVVMSGSSLPRPEAIEISSMHHRTSLYERFFRLIAAGLVAYVLVSVVPESESWLTQIHLASRWGGFILIGVGLLHLGLSNHPFRVVLGLLTVLSGFEILYSALETSTLVAGMLAGITLGLALVCAYLVVAPTMEKTL